MTTDAGSESDDELEKIYGEDMPQTWEELQRMENQRKGFAPPSRHQDLVIDDPNSLPELFNAIIAEDEHRSLMLAKSASEEDLGFTDSSGWNALMFASYMGLETVCMTLIDMGIDVMATESITERTALHIAAYFGHIAVVKAICEAGANLNYQDDDGNSALHRVAMSGHYEVLNYLLEAGAETRVQNHNGQTPLHLAVIAAEQFSVQGLCDHGFVDGRDFDGNTPLHLAAQKSDQVVCQLLLEGGADPSIRNFNGKLPRDMSVMRDIIRLLDLPKYKVKRAVFALAALSAFKTVNSVSGRVKTGDGFLLHELDQVRRHNMRGLLRRAYWDVRPSLPHWVLWHHQRRLEEEEERKAIARGMAKDSLKVYRPRLAPTTDEEKAELRKARLERQAHAAFVHSKLKGDSKNIQRGVEKNKGIAAFYIQRCWQRYLKRKAQRRLQNRQVSDVQRKAADEVADLFSRRDTFRDYEVDEESESESHVATEEEIVFDIQAWDKFLDDYSSKYARSVEPIRLEIEEAFLRLTALGAISQEVRDTPSIPFSQPSRRSSIQSAWVIQWHSGKGGKIGYTLSNGVTGCLFPDKSKGLLYPDSHVELIERLPPPTKLPNGKISNATSMFPPRSFYHTAAADAHVRRKIDHLQSIRKMLAPMSRNYDFHCSRDFSLTEDVELRSWYPILPVEPLRIHEDESSLGDKVSISRAIGNFANDSPRSRGSISFADQSELASQDSQDDENRSPRGNSPPPGDKPADEIEDTQPDEEPASKSDEIEEVIEPSTTTKESPKKKKKGVKPRRLDPSKYLKEEPSPYSSSPRSGEPQKAAKKKTGRKSSDSGRNLRNETDPTAKESQDQSLEAGGPDWGRPPSVGGDGGSMTSPVSTIQPTSPVEEFPPMASVPAPRSRHTACRTNRLSMIVYGGESQHASKNKERIVFNDMWEFSFVSETWLLIPNDSGPEGRFGHTATPTADGSGMIVFGGQNAKAYFNDVWRYDFESGQWNLLHPGGEMFCPPAVSNHSSILVPTANASALVVYGGQTPGSGRSSVPKASGAVWKFGMSTNSWTCLWKPKKGASGPEGRSYHGAFLANPVVTNDATMVIFGGQAFDETPPGGKPSPLPRAARGVWSFSLTLKQWSEVQVTGGTGAPECHGQSYVRFGHSCATVGGWESKSGNESDVWIISLRKNAPNECWWRKVTTKVSRASERPLVGRGWHSTVVTDRGSLLCFGGVTLKKANIIGFGNVSRSSPRNSPRSPKTPRSAAVAKVEIAETSEIWELPLDVHSRADMAEAESGRSYAVVMDFMISKFGALFLFNTGVVQVQFYDNTDVIIKHEQDAHAVSATIIDRSGAPASFPAVSISRETCPLLYQRWGLVRELMNKYLKKHERHDGI